MAFGNIPDEHRVQLTVKGLRSAQVGPFDFQATAGCCTAISGPSGIGKTLLLRMIADLDPSEGEVRLGEVERSQMPGPAWRRQVSYVAADTGWWAETIADHMEDLGWAMVLLPQVGLETTVLSAAPDRLSTGQRQRLALVRAIVRNPQFLLLDEPTSSLDIEAMLLVEAMLGRLMGEGVGLVVVSHSPDQVQRIAQRHVSLSDTGLQEIFIEHR